MISALLLWVLVLETKSLFGFSVKVPEVGDLISPPKTHLVPQFMELKELPEEIKSQPEFSDLLRPVFEMVEKNENQKAYIGIGNFIEQNPDFPFNDSLLFLKADLLFKVFDARGQGDWNLVIEDYEQALKKSPNHPRAAAAFYQMALSKNILQRPFDVEKTLKEGLERFQDNLLKPYYLLLNADRAMQDNEYETAIKFLEEIQKDFSNHKLAKEAAFRKAFALVKLNQFKQASLLYKNIESFFPNDFKASGVKIQAGEPDRLIDRFLFAEALFKSKSFDQASIAFQNLGNLHPDHENAAFAWIRYGDTFLKRKRPQAAQKVYEHVIEYYSKESLAVALARLRYIDVLEDTDRLRYEKVVEAELEGAARQAMTMESRVLAEAAWLKLANYFISIKNTSKAKRILDILREQFLSAPSAAWVKQEHEKITAQAEREYVDTIQTEILAFYRMGDRLAALTTYLANEKIKFTDVEALLRAGEAAIALELFDKAESILNRVVYLESNSLARQEALLKLINIIVRKKDVRKAAERLRRFNFAYPVSPLKFLYEKAWGDIYKELNRPERAISHYEEALRLALPIPGAVIRIRSVYMSLGEMYSKIKLPLKAIDAYSKFIELYKDKEKFRIESIPLTKKDAFDLNLAKYRTADIYFDMKDYAQAVMAYQVVSQEIRQEPFHSHALYRMGECYLALEDRKLALNIFEKLSAQTPVNFWTRAAAAYMKTVQMENNHGIRILN